MKSLNIGILGLGQVGSGVYSILRSKSKDLQAKCNTQLNIVQIAVRNKSKKRLISIDRSKLTTDAKALIRNPKIDVIVEVMGGIHPAKEYILAALRSGKDVVTANKALLAESGKELFEEAKRLKRNLFFEASVGGGIPIIKTLREGMVGNKVESIQSIINGTCNYILTRMSEQHLDFAEALKLAQQKGYAEANPKLDIEGIDAAHKITILANLVFGGWINFKEVDANGISRIQREDIIFAKEFGYTIKLLAIARRAKGSIEIRVEPTLLPKKHVLSHVNDSFNAILIKGDSVGEILLYGRGAGSLPTGSAVVSDLVDIARIRNGESSNGFALAAKKLKVEKAPSLVSRYYLRLHVNDRPGVLSKITDILGKHKISISDVFQRERRNGSMVPLILLTHETYGAYVQKAVKTINDLKMVKEKIQVIRIEGYHDKSKN